MNKYVLVVKQRDNEAVWKRLRNLAWRYDKDLFYAIDEKHTFKVESESNDYIKWKN